MVDEMSDMSEMNGRIALVTGATSGIGRATCQRLHADGWQVAGVGREVDRLTTLQHELPGFLPIVMDVTQSDAAQRIVGATVERFGALHGLVNAAGILEAGSHETTTAEDWDRTMNLNLRSVFLLTQAALPFLKQSNPVGSVVNVSSVSGLRPFPGVLSYCVSKAAVDQLTRCLAIELAGAGVRVNAVNPGVVVTELHRRGGMTPEAYEAFLERGRTTHPLGRVGQPEEIAGAIAWLLSDEASWITGETMPIDGGRHLTAAR
jgi:NAD(P)-dependent dehydrogenase (short-subunit alcohol dehydrogenase family)